MKQMAAIVAAACLVAQGVVAGQGKDASAVLAGARAAMGGDKLAAVKTLSAEGRTLRTGPDGNTREMEFEMALQLPDKYLMRSVMMAMGNMSIYRHTGFNGGQAIEEIDRPPNLAGGNVVIRVAGPGGTTTDMEQMTPEQREQMLRARLQQNRRDFARMALGMFAASPEVFPLEFSYAGEAESPDGKADVLDVKGEGDFAARLFIDQRTQLPLMLSWMDKEPISIQMGPGGITAGGGGSIALPGGGTFVQRTETAGPPPSREEMERRLKELEEKRRELEASRRTVEFRVYYADYQTVGGVTLPHRIQRAVDGKPTEEMIFDSLKVNPKIDAKKFQVSK